MSLPVALTLGDPAGIGPEIILKSAPALDLQRDLVVYGSRAVLDWTANALGLPHFDGTVVDVEAAGDLPRDYAPGRATAWGAALQYQALTQAIDDALAGRVAALTTAPWTKHILSLAGLPATGHTEVLAARAGHGHATMMLCGPELRVALATTHIPLSRVADVLTAELVERHLLTLQRDLVRLFAIESPRVAVCGLNPHAGEGGLMGREDEALIRPVIRRLAGQIGPIEGPFAADTLFARAVRSDRYDAILAMYHDQGLVPLKLWHFGQAANVTLGLSVIRTSVDHGTAYDIAGRGMADPSSLIYAIELAAGMADRLSG